MIGCPSHRAPLGLMVFRPGMGGRREQGGAEMDREKVFCCDQFVVFVRVGFVRDREGHATHTESERPLPPADHTKGIQTL